MADPDVELMEKEAQRITFAATRVAEHADRELALLTLATEAETDARAQELECQAHGAYQDFVAMIEEHGLSR